MNYLDPSEYQAYGLETTTDASWVTLASAMLDSHCRRPTLAVAQYTERIRVLEQYRPALLSYRPLAAVAPATTPIVAARARYGAARRGNDPFDDLSASVAAVFGIPGTWADLNAADFDWDADTGEISLPLNLFGWVFNELEIVYTAGLDPIANAVKVACAQIVKNAQATPALNVKKGMLDRMQLMYFSDSLLDEMVQSLLAPYVAQKVG